MKAMILAAGRGKRMRPLTDQTPKPLLKVADKCLIEYHLERLAKLGITEVVINHAWLGEQIPAHLGNGDRYGLTIHYSDESAGALETAGGIIKALPLLTNGSNDQEPFLVINGDVFVSGDLPPFPNLADNILAHLWLVENPIHNTKGDFFLSDNYVANQALQSDDQSYTFSGIALYRPAFFYQQLTHKKIGNEKLALAPMLRHAADHQQVTGQLLNGTWVDVGTPERLAQLNQQVSSLPE
ncbi:N-acetylmuramate alpha-1-phosphate uridylyltransferase MurU [Colwellia sp. MEBiC06753]